MSDPLKLFIRKDHDININCPNCRDKKVIPAKKVIGEHRIKIICNCKHVFELELEYRKKFRKRTNLDGYFEKLTKIQNDKDEWASVHWETQSLHLLKYNCKIKNISVIGLGFVAFYSHDLRVNDLMRIKFYLDNSAQSLIEKIYIVRSVNVNYIGCENYRPDHFDKDLGFYLLS
ncbi:hypothetical protein ACFL6N_06185 [Thermodesulfobacteriota bacterium]